MDAPAPSPPHPTPTPGLELHRWGNQLFEPTWSRKYIESVQLTFKEDLGTGGRGGYFDSFGIIRDIIQNHLLQAFMWLAMEPPATLSAQDIVRAKVALLKRVTTLRLDPNKVFLGQFGASGGEAAYLDDETVPRDSKCPTFASLALYVDNARWRGVPFLFTAGKGMDERVCELRVRFRPQANNAMMGSEIRNEIVMRVQPDEAVYMITVAKEPGITAEQVRGRRHVCMSMCMWQVHVRARALRGSLRSMFMCMCMCKWEGWERPPLSMCMCMCMWEAQERPSPSACMRPTRLLPPTLLTTFFRLLPSSSFFRPPCWLPSSAFFPLPPSSTHPADCRPISDSSLQVRKPVVMDMTYKQQFADAYVGDAYERMFLNAARGEQVPCTAGLELAAPWPYLAVAKATPLLHLQLTHPHHSAFTLAARVHRRCSSLRPSSRRRGASSRRSFMPSKSRSHSRRSIPLACCRRASYLGRRPSGWTSIRRGR